MRFFSILVVWLFLAGTSYAQHPCDPNAEAESGQVLEGTAIYATFCQAVVQNVEAVTIYRDGVGEFISVLEILSTPNSQGLVQYRASMGQAPNRGTYTYTSATWNRDENGTPQEGAQSVPFVLSVVAAPVQRPTAPSKFRVR